MAFYWFQRSAKQGNALAQLELAIRYYQGKPVQVDYEKAFEWVDRA